MRKLTSGVLHTKFWVIDKKHVYIGSANMDWRSLTQVHTHTHTPIHIVVFSLNPSLWMKSNSVVLTSR